MPLPPAVKPTRPPSARARPASGGQRAAASPSSWKCVFCAHVHDHSLPYCELCAKVRPPSGSSSGKNFAPRPRVEPGAASAEWFDDGTEGQDGRGGGGSGSASWETASASSSASSRGARQPASAGSGPGGGSGDGHKPRRRPAAAPGGGRTVDEPLRPPGASRGGIPPLWAGTAADRDRALEAERSLREAARAQGGVPRRGGGSARQHGSAYRSAPKPAPRVPEQFFVVSSDSEEEEDWYNAHLASRWAKSKAQQAEKEEALRAQQAKRDAAFDAEQARLRHEQAAEADRVQAETSAARKASEGGWEAFAALPADAAIRMRDVPWPALDADALGLSASKSSKAQRKQAFRALSLRWHPDKFVQGFGGRLAEGEREAILSRVTEVAQAINSIYQEARARP
jgi:hypothetical protein